MLKKIKRQTKKQNKNLSIQIKMQLKKWNLNEKTKKKLQQKKYIFNLHFFNYIHKFTFEKLPKLKQQKIKNLKS